MLDIEKWTPLATFAVAYGVAVFSAIGLMVKSAGDGGRAVTRLRILEAFVYWGPLSVACPMLVWASPLVQKSQIIAVAMAALIALSVIKVTDFYRYIKGLLKLEDRDDELPKPS